MDKVGIRHSSADETADQLKPYHAKRPHRKSRKGCLNCKSRKVKCDEQRPCCRTCLLRKDTCTYASSSSLPSPSSSAASPRSSSSLSQTADTPEASSISPQTLVTQWVSGGPFAAVHEPLAILPGCDGADMKIIWHFLVNAWDSFSIEEGNTRPVQEVMRVDVMRHAFDVKFLFQSIMALSCLHAHHLAGDDMGDPYRKHRYMSESLEDYRQAIQTADPATFSALLVNSLLITALSAETFRQPDSSPLYMLDWMLVWRGIGAIFRHTESQISSHTKFAPLFRRPVMDFDSGWSHVPQDLVQLFVGLYLEQTRHPDVQTYFQGLKYLGTLYQNLREGGFNAVLRLRIITWFTYLPPSLVILFRRKQPHALIILAHYAMFLKLATDVWWLVGVGDRSLRDIYDFLGQKWQKSLPVLTQAIQIHDPTELARLLLGDAKWEPRRLPNDGWDEKEEQETRGLSLVDDQGRQVHFSGDERVLVLSNPKGPGDYAIWNSDD